jgi:hypothetical protein
MEFLAVVVGAVMVLAVLADVINTLITTTRSTGRWWLTRILYTYTWRVVRVLGRRIADEQRRERFYSWFGPISVIAMLVTWVTQQVIGFGLIWWGLDGIEGAHDLGDSMYYSGVVYFTLGFGEIVPSGALPRFGALVEALSGVLTTALVIGYLPALYAAYSQREQKLLTLDDGTEDRITPTSLVLSRAPDGDLDRLEGFFKEWEAWVAQVLETHTTFPMLGLFRSQHPGQHWITALGLVTDAALHVEICVDSESRSAYWMMRRSVRLFQTLTETADLTRYEHERDERYRDDTMFRELHSTLSERGFDVKPYDEAYAYSRDLRKKYDAELEYLIDLLEAPRGFWGHAIGHRRNDVGASRPITP